MGYRTTGTLTADAAALDKTSFIEVEPDGEDLVALLIETDGALVFSGWVLGDLMPQVAGSGAGSGQSPKGFFLQSGAAGLTRNTGLRVNGSLMIAFPPNPLVRKVAAGRILVTNPSGANRFFSFHALFSEGIRAYGRAGERGAPNG